MCELVCDESCKRIHTCSWISQTFLAYLNFLTNLNFGTHLQHMILYFNESVYMTNVQTFQMFGSCCKKIGWWDARCIVLPIHSLTIKHIYRFLFFRFTGAQIFRCAPMDSYVYLHCDHMKTKSKFFSAIDSALFEKKAWVCGYSTNTLPNVTVYTSSKYVSIPLGEVILLSNRMIKQLKLNLGIIFKNNYNILTNLHTIGICGTWWRVQIYYFFNILKTLQTTGICYAWWGVKHLVMVNYTIKHLGEKNKSNFKTNTYIPAKKYCKWQNKITYFK